MKVTAEIVTLPAEELAEPLLESGQLCIISGGLHSNPTWKEYLSDWGPGERAIATAIRRCIERSALVGLCGDEFCNDFCFRMSDSVLVAFTWRAWGDLMQAIVGRREGYMAYYMSDLLPRERGVA